MDVLQSLTHRLGGDYYGSYAVLPGPGHSARDRSLSVTIGRGGRLIYNSFAGDDHEVVRTYLGLTGSDAPRRCCPVERRRMARDLALAKAQERDRKAAFCQEIWAQTTQIEQTIAETYLRTVRGITTDLPATLRFHPSAPLDYRRAHTAPAMVALVQSVSGEMAGLHVTALMPDGSGKAAGSSCRRIYGSVQGAAVRLGDPGRLLAVAEGIETALSYQQLTGKPTWAALSSPGIASFAPPRMVDTLVVAADGDLAGRRAATTLADRVKTRATCVINPAPEGQDWNDVIREGL